jgi:hypothetical protein
MGSMAGFGHASSFCISRGNEIALSGFRHDVEGR